MKFCLIVLSIVLVLNASYCAKTNPQIHLASKNTILASQLTKSSLGNGLISLVNMYSQNKENESDWSDLYDALELLKASLQKKTDVENADFESDKQVHQTEVERLSNLITEYESQQAIFEETKQQLTTKQEGLKGQLTNLESQLDFAVENKQKEEEYLEQILETYEKEVEDFDQAINLLGQALEKLNEAKQSSLEAGFQAFLQTSNIDFSSFSVLIDNTLNRVKNSKLYYTKPITSVFLAMANKQDVAPSTIDNAIEALTNLRDLFNKGKVQLKIDYEADKKVHENLVTEYTTTIQNLNDVQIPQVNSLIEVNQAAIDTNEESLQEVLLNIRIQEQFLKEENESWAKRKEIHDLLIPKLAEELQIVVQAEQVLEAKKPKNTTQ